MGSNSQTRKKRVSFSLKPEHESGGAEPDSTTPDVNITDDIATASPPEESAANSPEPKSPAQQPAPQEAADPAVAAVSNFSELSLDPRLHRAVDRLGWRKPTPVQSAVIPAAMAGRDVMVCAPTGSGKTAAYAVPLIQALCRSMPVSSTPSASVRAVVLVPTRELVHQVSTVLKALSRFVDGLRVASVTPPARGVAKKASRGSHALGDVVVGTPATVAGLRDGEDSSPLGAVEFVVLDEADLVLSYGYEKDARDALAKIPTSAQSMLLSATLETEGMDSFKKVVLRRPLTVKITSDGDEMDDVESGAMHYFSPLKNAKDRYLVTFAMLRLGVISGKVLIFVNQINSAFRLKLFLDQFKVKSAVLNAELPANSRIHCVEQFNAGVFDILIASDESQTAEKGNEKSKKSGMRRTKKRLEKDEEFGLARGVDFKGVAAVLNFDNPLTMESYTHRAGRTARGGKSGTVLTLLSSQQDVNRLVGMGQEIGLHIGPLAFRMEQVEAFRYRVEDCLRLVTDTAVTGARLADVRRELENAETLKDYFEENPNDLEALQHNIRLAKNVQEHLGHIPKYLVPVEMREASGKARAGKGRKTRAGGKRRKVMVNKNNGQDPLRGFSVAGSSKQRFREKHGIKKKTREPAQVKTRRRRS